MKMTTAVCAFLLSVLFCGMALGQSLRPTKVSVNGVELHYVERGHGSARENPAAFNEVARNFLSKHGRRLYGETRPASRVAILVDAFGRPSTLKLD